MEKLYSILKSCKKDEEELLTVETKLTKEIQIKNFSSIKHCKESRAYFVLNDFEPPVIFCVSVYPLGVSLQSEGYISVQFLELFIDTGDSFYVHDVFWMLSIVDVNGHGHYCQSFTNENITGYPYNLAVSKFTKRTIIEDNADLLLPDDVLTLRCELSYISKRELKNTYQKSVYFDKKIWYLSFKKIYVKEVWKPPLLPIKNFDDFQNSDLVKAIQANLNYKFPGICSIVHFCRRMDTIMEMFLKNFLSYISYMNLSDLESLLDLYARSIPMDDICETYITCNCIFQTYIVCKRIYREELNKIPLDKNMLKLGYFFFFKWLNIPLMKMKEKYFNFLDVPLCDRIENVKQTKLSIMNERSFVEEVVNTFKIQRLPVSCCNGWNCIQDAFVYLLIDEDMVGVSENVLRYPVRDYRVKEIDMDCQINFLHFLHDGNIQTKSMTALCKLYEMAEDYDVKDLRNLSAQEMESVFTKDNIDSVEKIRQADDYYLKEKIASFKRKLAQSEEWFVN